jgi:hypothetical protein
LAIIPLESLERECRDMSVKRRAVLFISGIVMAVMLSACLRASTPEPVDLRTTAPAAALTPTQIERSHLSPSPISGSPGIASFTPGSSPVGTIGPTPIPDIFSPRAMKDDEKLYIDPEGWFSVYIPADWEEGETPGTFSGGDGFVEIGYLPDLGFMSRRRHVLIWLANIAEAPEGSLIEFEHKVDTLTEDGLIISQTVFENPQAGHEHRFVHIRGDGDHFAWIENSFAWLKPIDLEADPAFHEMTLRPEDAAFWENTDPIPAGITVHEYKLGEEGQNADPSEGSLRGFVPPEILALGEKRGGDALKPTPVTMSTEEKLAAYGYELKAEPEDEKDYPHTNLYQDGELLLTEIYKLESAAVILTSSGETLFLTLTTLEDNPEGSRLFHSYVVRGRDVLERRYQHTYPSSPPFLYKGEIVWLRSSETRFQLENLQGEVVMDYATFFGYRSRFQLWDDHLILDLGCLVIQDGEILNERYGFEEIFHWRTIDNKPFYFFRKGKFVGFSYDGSFYPLNYHHILSGHWANSPGGVGKVVTFYGQREGEMYYGILEFD